MRTSLRGLAIVPIAGLLLAACQGGTGSGSASASAGGEANACADASGEDLLATICEEGTIQISTDPNYAPQSFLKDDGTFEGFDIDVANEIGERLGVDVEFVTPSFDLVQAGGWNGQWDVSVGSITITESRKDVLDFTEPYYFTPAQLAASEESGITSIDGFAGETICVGAATTYLDWINGDLALGDGSTPAEVPEGVEAAALETDALCAESIAAGRDEFTGWLSSSTTVQQAINDEVPIVTVGEPVFFEPLAVATDKSGPEHAQLQEALDQIVADMHADGTLTELSEKWYEGVDLTKATE
jgi:polar amino acid transport system substrate-binding protein